MGTSRRRGNNEGSNPIQRADGRWQINIRYTDESGNSHRRSVSGRTAQEARTKRDALIKRIKAGQPARDSSAPVSTFVESWITSTLAVSSRKAATKSLYGTVARKHVSGTMLGRTPLSRVKPSTVEAWLVEVRGRGLSDSTVRTCYTVLRAVFDTAVRDEAVATNPVAKIPRPPVKKKEAACLSASEAADLLESARESRYAPLFRSLRHSAATLMLMNGTPVKVVSEVLGHSSISITGDIYGHVNPDVAREALTGLGTSLANGVR